MTHTIRGVAVFRDGVHQGREYTVADVEMLARAARWTGAPVPVRLGGHGRAYPEAGRASNFAVGEDGTLVCDLELSDAAAARIRAEHLCHPSIGHTFTHTVCCEAVHEVALVARGDVPLPPIVWPDEDEDPGLGGTE